MFEVIDYAGKDKDCPHCEKLTECLLVRCKAGTYEGPMCPKCLTRATRIRSAGARKSAPSNGQAQESTG
jgi:hypothetical protein